MTAANDVAGRQPRRLPVVAAVLAALTLAGAASVTIHPPAGRPASAALAKEVDGLPGANSTAWFCAGPLPVGVPHEASSLAIANYGSRQAVATVTIVPASGAVVTEQVALPAEEESVVGFAALHVTSSAAARVVVEGGGVAVAEVVNGPEGPDEALCRSEAAANQYLAVGSTAARNNLAIALYDPGATPAVANVSFATAIGPQSPPAFQGVLVAAGHVVVLSVAHSLPFRRFISATISSSGGGIVAGALASVENKGATLAALEGAVTAPATRWFFAAAPAGTAAEQAYDLMNPGSRTADVEIRLGGPSGVGEITLSLAAGATTRYVPAAADWPQAVRWASVTVLDSEPIVAARELLIGRAIAALPARGRNAAQRERRARDELPALPVGYTITSGAAAARGHWLIVGGESDRRLSEFVTVTDFSARRATVWIRPLVGSFAGLGPLRVAADGSLLVDLADLPSAKGRLVLRVTADAPVVASAELYLRR